MPATFTLAASGAVPCPPRKPKAFLALLGKVWKDWTSPGCYEPVKAVTADGAWLFERAQDGTWAAGHLPRRAELKAGLRSLRACRLYAGSGRAQADLDRLLTEKKENVA